MFDKNNSGEIKDDSAGGAEAQIDPESRHQNFRPLSPRRRIPQLGKRIGGCSRQAEIEEAKITEQPPNNRKEPVSRQTDVRNINWSCDKGDSDRYNRPGDVEDEVGLDPAHLHSGFFSGPGNDRSRSALCLARRVIKPADSNNRITLARVAV